MMVKQALSIPQQVTNDDNVDDQYAQHRLGEAMDQLIDFNWNEEGRFANGQPSGPAYAEQQSHSLHQRKEAVEQGSRCNVQDLNLG